MLSLQPVQQIVSVVDTLARRHTHVYVELLRTQRQVT